jgi:hypothetical protein
MASFDKSPSILMFLLQPNGNLSIFTTGLDNSDFGELSGDNACLGDIPASAPVAPVVNKEATNVFDFDDNEPELKIDTTPLKATRTKKGRRNTQESKTVNAEVKNTLGSPNHIVRPFSLYLQN